MSDDAMHDHAHRIAGAAAAVRRSAPDRTNHLSDAALEAFVREGIGAAATLGITDDGDVLRFMSLPLVLSPAQRSSLMIQTLATKVLDRKEWSGRKRLDFIYRHLVPRTPSPESESYLRPLLEAGMDDQHQ